MSQQPGLSSRSGVLRKWTNIISVGLVVALVFFVVIASNRGFSTIVFGTEYPVVSVISNSMEHRASMGCSRNVAEGVISSLCPEAEMRPMICGMMVNETGYLDIDTYWLLCGSWYEERDIDKIEFAAFPLSQGFNKGDIMILTAAKDIKIGDLVVFQTLKDTPIIHRVIDIKRTDRGLVYETKGDFNAGQLIEYDVGPLGREVIVDERSVNEAQLIGKAAFRIPWLGLLFSHRVV